MEDVLMQVNNPLDKMDRSKPHTLALHRPLPDDGLGDEAQASAIHPVPGEGESRLAEIRARVLSGAYDSLDMAERVARAIVRSGDLSAWYER